MTQGEVLELLKDNKGTEFTTEDIRKKIGNCLSSCCNNLKRLSGQINKRTVRNKFYYSYKEQELI